MLRKVCLFCLILPIARWEFNVSKEIVPKWENHCLITNTHAASWFKQITNNGEKLAKTNRLESCTYLKVQNSHHFVLLQFRIILGFFWIAFVIEMLLYFLINVFNGQRLFFLFRLVWWSGLYGRIWLNCISKLLSRRRQCKSTIVGTYATKVTIYVSWTTPSCKHSSTVIPK